MSAIESELRDTIKKMEALLFACGWKRDVWTGHPAQTRDGWLDEIDPRGREYLWDYVPTFPRSTPRPRACSGCRGGLHVPRSCGSFAGNTRTMRLFKKMQADVGLAW